MTGHRDRMEASGLRKLGLQQFNEINKQLANNDSNLDLPGSERTAWDNTASSDPRPMPEKVTESLAKVENACDTAITDGNDLMRQFTLVMEPLSDTDRTILQCLRKTIEAPPSPEFLAGVSGPSGVTYGIWTSLLDSNCVLDNVCDTQVHVRPGLPLGTQSTLC